MKTIKTQVGIIGAGPAGLTLAHWLKKEGISSVIIEHRSQEYVQARVRAGLLEQNTVDIFKNLGLADRLVREGQEHHGVYLNFDGKRIRVPFGKLTNGRNITIYGQQEVVKDLTEAWVNTGETLLFEAPALELEGIDSQSPKIHFEHEGEKGIIECDFIAACDGFHGLGRKSMPKDSYKEYTVTYPFSWLGILANVAPSSEELIYAYHERGFALHSLRSEKVSRLYIQVDNDDHVDNWTDEQIWEELSIRLGTEGWELKSGPIFEKSITPMRSYFIDNMQHGRLFLAGDAAHIVPPTGGKGLNLAVADVKHLVDGFTDFYKNNSMKSLDDYSKTALKRIWRAQDFSNFMTTLFHKQAEHGSFQYQLQKAKFEYISLSEAYATTIAENYVGLPFETFED
ncbi:monooxygenase FAD-binding protein [Emticicia oligotrophica DSM 17448]|uniref:Monooxygenase FAD-binding protein n=1 Tax=Emticicia oligotrophica (strain DSM 17448 / CIP 109782 / MTCC 6937 / GPTSA100-15) TaxID=929562 RepID=A0ABN4AKJ4_EMTOG|nr:4-hydroxybenzoate 3-monooxygenase [Emticicia oligotrophica]AFK02723.1 monooxygenase FAD-binding protein [Emticicia oligotrophica DSM 17448]